MVLVQVENIVPVGTLDPKLVQIPGILVDAVIVASPENHYQTFGEKYRSDLFQAKRAMLQNRISNLILGDRKVIARRAALELTQKAIS